LGCEAAVGLLSWVIFLMLVKPGVFVGCIPYCITF